MGPEHMRFALGSICRHTGTFIQSKLDILIGCQPKLLSLVRTRDSMVILVFGNRISSDTYVTKHPTVGLHCDWQRRLIFRRFSVWFVSAQPEDIDKHKHTKILTHTSEVVGYNRSFQPWLYSVEEGKLLDTQCFSFMSTTLDSYMLQSLINHILLLRKKLMVEWC